MLPILFALQVAATEPRPDPALVFHGRAGATEVAAPRIDAEVEVDGTLDEEVWRRAAILTGFSQYRPIDGVAADDSTDVLIWYSADALYVGIRAFEPHGEVNATLPDRDAVFSDDNVQLLLDTYDDRRRALVFALNPYGVQADGVRDEAQQGGSGFFNAEAAEGGTLDLRPDFVFASRGRLTEAGYEIEVRIPFQSIRFQSADRQSWGINVVRTVQHAGQTQTWTAARRGETSFLAQSGRLVDLYALDRGLVLDIQPEVTRQLAGAPVGPEGERWNYSDDGTEVGVNARWGITPNLTFSATVNPDFSQVESDVAQIQFDPRQAVGFPEQRPFFLENSENFAVPGGIIHTRTVVDPLAAVKLAGKIAGTEVGLLTAVDDTLLSTGGHHPIVNLLRVRRDLGSESTLGLAYTDRIDGDDYNRVGSLDGKLVFGAHTVRFQGAGSFTREGAVDFSGPLWDVRAERSGREFGWVASLRGIDDEFLPGSGFLSRTGVVYQSITPRWSFYREPGSRLESWSTAVNFNNTWLYDRFIDGEMRPDELKVHFNNSFRFRGGWNAGLALLLENFLYPEDLYANYRIARTQDGVTDTIPFTGTPSINNYDVVLSGGTPQFQTFSANGFVLLGRDENYPEWAPGWLVWAETEADWRPTQRLRVSPRYSETRVMRPDDWSLVTLTQIPRLRVEYQVARPVFVRFVGQYVAVQQDSLHDDSRTEQPILRFNPETATYSRAGRFQSNSLRLDALFSYQPTPGTVIFAGYGTSFGAVARGFDPRLRVDDVDRTADGFFLKVSYLFRL